MKITTFTLWQLALPLKESYTFSGGRQKVSSLTTTFLRIETDEGLTGWGESCPWGEGYLPAHAGGIKAAIVALEPSLLGCDPRALDEINRTMDSALPGHWAAKSAVDIACWDILGQATGLPLWKLLGGAEARRVELNSSIPSGSAEQMIASIRAARAKGYRTHSAKVGGKETRLEIARMEAVADALQKDENLTFDVNRAWTPSEAIAVLNEVSSRHWIEQPCETLSECAHVASRVRQPLMLDECLHTAEDHLQAWQRGACEGVKIKPHRAGGLTKARFLRDLALSFGWRMHIEDVGGSALADTAAFHLASATPASHRLASWLAHEHLTLDPVAGQGVRNDKGFATPPSLPGLGVVPNLEVLGDPLGK